MGNFSRVKKNAQLYQEVIEDDKTSIIESSLLDYERRVKRGDVSSDYIASRLKKNKNIEEKTVVEETFNDEIDLKAKDEKVILKEDILRDRDLLADFIEEVKHYNINRGLRTVADTQMNILETLHKSDDKVEEDLDLTSEIQQIISDFEVLDEQIEEVEVLDKPIIKPLNEDKTKQLINVFEEIETSAIKVVDETSDKIVFDKEEVIEEIINDKDFKSNELLELTQTLNLKLDLNEENKVVEVNKKAVFIDKLLTFFIAILVFALLVMIGIGIWWVAKERGF